jgi:hypothetical protein
MTYKYGAWCQTCVWQENPQMLTGYGLAVHCDRCQWLRHCALVILPEKVNQIGSLADCRRH